MFNHLAVCFETLYNKYTPWSSSGRMDPDLKTVAAAWTLYLPICDLKANSSTMDCFFGCKINITSLYVRFGPDLLIKVLHAIEGAEIEMLLIEEDIRLFQSGISAKYPH